MGQYDEKIKKYNQFSKEASDSLDKYVFSVGTGAILLSITFIGNISNSPLKTTIWNLKVSWFCLIFSAFLSLLSFWFSKTSSELYVDVYNLIEKNKTDEAFKKDKSGKKFSAITKITSFSSLISLILGITFLALFAITNLEQSIDLKKSENQIFSKSTEYRKNNDNYIVIANSLNVRKKPNGEIINNIIFGMEVTVVNESNNWSLIKYTDIEKNIYLYGWVRGNYLEKILKSNNEN